MFMHYYVAPSAPLNVEAVAVTSSSITWIWDKPANHNNKVTHYQVYNGAVVNITTGTYYKWTGLSANTQYSIRVRAVTGSGIDGSWSSWEYASTLPPGMYCSVCCIAVIAFALVA